jgi:AmmeMemoRadiSam system protein B/AmmeMemoRadiSam system protein A
MPTTRPAAVAGMFYPSDPAELSHDIQTMLMHAQPEAPPLKPKALIVPHAGYVYSGPVAASGYALLASRAREIKRVILLGPTHRVAVRGLALPGADAFETPLGRVEIDLDAARTIAELPQVTVSPQVHALEHSLEVHLPFLQSLLPDFKLLPLAVGMAAPGEVAEVLEKLWGGDETLIVISSDLSHYLPYEQARKVDERTATDILNLKESISHECACGGTPINGLMLAAKHHGLVPHLLDLRSSGDTAGDKNRVVGYAAFALTEEQQQQPHTAINKGNALLKLARNAIAQGLSLPTQPEPNTDGLNEPGATFVTLTRRGQLRGCIGSLEARQPLLEDVRQNALAAAFRDSRFPPVTAEEFDQLRVAVSLLSPQQPIQFSDEADALSQLRPHIDGVVFEYGTYRSTFLPQVWEQLPQPWQFMAHLKRKAGLPQDFWSPEIRLYRYTVEKWKEKE